LKVSLERKFSLGLAGGVALLLVATLAVWPYLGRYHFAAVAIVAALALGSAAVGGFALRRELAQRRHADDAMLLGESRYRALLNAIDEGFCVIEVLFDPQGKPVDYRFLEVNPAFEKQTGLTDAAGKTMRELAPLHEAHWFETYGRIATTGEPARFQNRAEQLRRWYDVYAFRIGDPRLRQVAILFNDISGRKKAEAALNERTEQLEAANNELEAFSYSVSHDLRAPLRHIEGFGGMLEKHLASSLDEKGRRYITTIRDASTKMGTLIEDILSFSRLGRTPLAMMDIDHDSLVAAVVRDGHFGEGRTIAWEISPLPRVRGDAAMLRQVWSNLIENAVKYSRDASPQRIGIGSRGADDPGLELVFFVRDNGVGFDPSQAGRLFGVFQRLHDASQFEGTGIGLANVRRIVGRHGGRTWAESEVGKGATFYFSVPREPAQRA
jgi:PAS domain S-box-containing protein